MVCPICDTVTASYLPKRSSDHPKFFAIIIKVRKIHFYYIKIFEVIYETSYICS